MLVLAVDLGSEVWRCQVETRSFGLAWIINGKSNPAFTLTATHQRGWKSFIFNKRRRCTVMGSWAMWSWREKESLPELNFTQIRSKVMWWLQRQQEIVALLFIYLFIFVLLWGNILIFSFEIFEWKHDVAVERHTKVCCLRRRCIDEERGNFTGLFIY